MAIVRGVCCDKDCCGSEMKLCSAAERFGGYAVVMHNKFLLSFCEAQCWSANCC